MNRESRGGVLDFFSLHCAVLLFGAAGVVGKFVHIPPSAVVLCRTSIAGVVLGLLVNGSSLRPSSKADGSREGNAMPLPLSRLALSGALLAIHWYLFFLSIDLSSVAIGLLSFSTFPAFTALLEPFVSRVRLKRIDVYASVLVIVGLVLVVGPNGSDDGILTGAICGVASGLIFSLLSFINRSLGRTLGPIRTAFHQNAWAAIFTLTALTLTGATIYLAPSSLPYIVFLGVGCTAVAHSLFVRALESVPITTVAITTALEPIYGIVIAAILLHEVPGLLSVVGGALVLAAATWSTLQR